VCQQHDRSTQQRAYDRGDGRASPDHHFNPNTSGGYRHARRKPYVQVDRCAYGDARCDTDVCPAGWAIAPLVAVLAGPVSGVIP
jgi:hypothetical protein